MNNFESIMGAQELSNEELMMIQGGNIFGDIWHGITSGAKAVGHAAASAWNAVSSSKGQKVVGTITGIAGAIAGIISLF